MCYPNLILKYTSLSNLTVLSQENQQIFMQTFLINYDESTSQTSMWKF